MTKPGASTQARALAGTYNRGIGKPKIKPRPMWAEKLFTALEPSNMAVLLAKEKDRNK